MDEETKQQQSEQSAFSNIAVGALSTLLGALFLAAIGFLAAPLLGAAPFWLTFTLAISLVIGLPYFAWVIIRLGGSSAGSEHRQWYESFRFGFETGNYNGRYARGIGRAIEAIDRFFGDAGDKVLSGDADAKPLGLFPKAFGLRLPAPLWTAKSYDRCLRLALAYPVMAMFVFWTVWGGVSVGQAEVALGFELKSAHWERALGLGAAVGVGLAFLKSVSAKGWWSSYVWLALMSALGFIAYTVASTAALAGAGAFTGAALGAFTGAALGAFTGAALGAFIVTAALALALVGVGAGASASTLALALALTVAHLMNYPKQKKLLGPALLIFSLLMLTACLWLLPSLITIPTSLALLYFLVLLTLVNAPFDWAALGITRGLLRRGQQSGSFWPLYTAFWDLIASLVLMAMLALTILWATEIFNHSAILGGGGAVIDVSAYLAAMADPTQRGDPKYYWLYAMLFSSQIPAIANFVFSALCLLRGLPVINRRIVKMLPDNGDIGTWARLGASGMAASQLGVAVAVGLSLYYVLLVGFIKILNPLFANGLLGLLSKAQITPLLG